MFDLDESQIRKIYHDITCLWETDNKNLAQRLLDFSARLLCISANPPDADTPAVYILGWPEDKGERHLGRRPFAAILSLPPCP